MAPEAQAPAGLNVPIGGLTGALINAAVDAARDVKNACEPAAMGGEHTVSFVTNPGLFYEAFFSASGPELHVKFEETPGPDAPPVKE